LETVGDWAKPPLRYQTRQVSPPCIGLPVANCCGGIFVLRGHMRIQGQLGGTQVNVV
jgi:hypothetical protein